MSLNSKRMPVRGDKNILRWEFAAFFFILVFGSGLHFAFELSNFWYPVAPFAAVKTLGNMGFCKTMKFEYITIFITYDNDAAELENFVVSVNGGKVEKFTPLHKFLKKIWLKRLGSLLLRSSR